MKYWLTSTLTAFVFIIFSLFYIQDALGEEAELEIEIATITGDEAQFENKTIHGSYYTENDSYLIEIEDGKTVSESDLGYFERMKHWTNSQSMTRFIEEHRDFMRGKVYDPALFYEDEAAIYYVGSSYNDVVEELNVDRLDKGTGENITFSVAVPEESQASYLSVLQVQVIEEKIHVFVRLDGNGLGDIHHFEIDSKKEAMTHTEEIIDSKGNMNAYSYLLNEEDDVGDQEYLIFSHEESEWNEELEYEETILTELIAFHVETGESYVIDLLDAVANEETVLPGYYAIKDNYLYLFEDDLSGILVEPYNLTERKIEFPIRIELEEEYASGANSQFAANDELYLISDVAEGKKLERHLFIASISTGQISYHGLINVNFAGKEIPLTDYELYIYRTEEK